MKKIALNLLKSADEKLRSIGSKPQPQQHHPQSPTQPHRIQHHHHLPYQTQQYHHHQQQQQQQQRQYQQRQQQQQHRHQQIQQQQQHQQRQQQHQYHHHQQRQPPPLQQQQHPQQEPAPPPVPSRDGDTDNMAERRVQLRQGRRERRRDGDNGDDLKRRSRSEGPSGRRVIQSMDVGSNSSANNSINSGGGSNSRKGHHGSFERRQQEVGVARGGGNNRVGEGGGGRISPTRSDDEGGGGGGGFYNRDPPSASDSDSDSDRMRWTKNPLIVRRVKKSKADKRNSNGAENNTSNSSPSYTQLGQRSTNRESWVYLAPEGIPVPPANQDPQYQQLQQKGDGGGSNSGSMKNKYQKMEENRKKRIDIAVTSDEENTPASRISRLRQRALQGGLGNQPRMDNSRVTVSDHNGWGPQGSRVAGGGPIVMSDQGRRQNRGQGQLGGQYGQQAVAAQPQAYRSNVAKPAGVYAHQSPLNNQSRHTAVTQSSQPVSVPQRNVSDAYHQPVSSPVRQSMVRPFTDRGNTEAAVSSPSSGRKQFHTIPEPQLAFRAVHNSSPEINVKRFNPAVRVPSADSIYDSVSYSPEQQPVNNRHSGGGRIPAQRTFTQVNPPSQDVMEVQRVTAVQHQAPANQRGQSAITPYNEVVELRLKSARVIDRPLSQTFSDSRTSGRHADTGGGFHSDDSLDELFESNIQYLEREIGAGSSRKALTPVTRTSSLPDPRKSPHPSPQPGTPIRPRVTVSGQQSVRSSVQVPTSVHQPQVLSQQQQQSNKSELHFRVPLSPQAKNLSSQQQPPPPYIHIAEENEWSDSAYHPSAKAYTFGVAHKERKHSYDSTPLVHTAPRPGSEYYDRDDMSKSDTQLNAAIVTPTYRGSMLHPNYSAGRGCISDQNLTVEQTQGMFSDVEYDIEVSERVKKWEKFMKKPDFTAGGDGTKKPLALTPIEERGEGDRDSLMMPSEIRRSIRSMAQQQQQQQQQQYPMTTTASTAVAHSELVSMKPANSDPTLHLTGDARVLSKEGNVHRFFQVVQDPNAGLSGPNLSHSTSSVYIDLPHKSPQLFSRSTTVYQPGGIMSPDELRKHMLANQRSRAEAESGTPAAPDTPETSKRLSRYQDEIDEMKSVKHQSVHNLRRRFDEAKAAAAAVASATNTTTTASEDETNFEARVAKVSPTHKDGSNNPDWSRMITGLEDRIRDMEVWSPNMESTQGNVVSIERVKARTLQTIPFSEDPFWKEIEEMTTFDPNTLGGHLAVSEEMLRPVAALPPPESSPHFLPSAAAQPRQQSSVSVKDRLQRSKSLYTPNITPLTISVDPYTAGGKSSSLERGATGTDKYSGPNALDDVLEDIRTSLERKPLSPKRRAAGESSDSHRSSPGGHGWASEIIRTRTERLRGHAPEAPGPTAASIVWDSTTSSYGSHVTQPPVAITVSSNLRFQPQPQHATAPAPAAPAGGMTAGHYHLDPLLLKQKLLSTGLVEDERPEVPVRSRVPPMSLSNVSSSTSSSVAVSKPVAVAPPQAVVRSVVAPTQRAAPAGVRSSQQREKLSQVNNSMEDLRQLAVNVEQKIELIKSRLLTADDQNLDKILLSLRKFAPSVGPHSPTDTLNMEDFYRKKKTKLEDALGELERIYSNLDLNNDMLMDRAERRDYPSYRAKPGSAVSSGVSVTASIGSGLSPRPTSRTKASSVFISPVTPVTTVQAETSPYSVHRATANAESEKKTQSEFDAISKSFQAIIDEVNKTASLVSSASPQQPRTQPPLPEIKELQSKMYANREQQRHAASPETHRRALNITVNPQGNKPIVPTYHPGPTPKSPPAVAPKPFRVQTPEGASQKGPMSSPLYASISLSSVANTSPQPPVTSVVRAEVAQPAPEKREPRVRQRFRPKTAAQEDAALKRARSKSSPTITLQDLAAGNRAETESAASGEGTPTAKTQVSFQIEPAAGSKSLGGLRKPQLHLDTARAQQGAVVELQLKPPAMFQDQDSETGKPEPARDNQPSRVVAQPTVVRPMVSTTAPPLDSKTVVFSGSSPVPASPTTASTVSTAAKVVDNTSSSESSAEGRDRKGKQRMGRGVAMMVELFSSSDDERLRRSHPLHTRSAPDLSAEPAGSDDAMSVPKDAANLRPAELSRVLQQKSESESLQGSPAIERRASSGHNPVNAVQSDSMPSPQSPSNKPPFHPFRRQDRGSESSPLRSVPGSVSSESSSSVATGTTTTTSTSSTSTTSTSSKVTTATSAATTINNNTSATTGGSVVLRRPAKKTESAANKTVAGGGGDDENNEEDDEFQERPRSFHELLSSFEPDPNRLAKLSSLRKCASEEMYPGQTALTRRIFRSSSFTSEPDLHSQRDEAPTPQEVRQWTKL